MSAPVIKGPLIKGWCPGALRPMESGDGLIVRVRPWMAELSLQQARGIGALAMAHGNGFVQITNRANLQIRGISANGLPALTKGLMALDLLDASAEAEVRRNILVDPFWHEPETGHIADTPAIARGLAERLAARDAPALPGKFGFAVDAPFRMRYLADISADIRIESAWDDLIVRADGAVLGRKVATGVEAVTLAMALAQWFVDTGGVGADGRGRMRDHLESGVPLPEHLMGDTKPGTRARAYRPGDYGGRICVGLAFGQIPAKRLIWLADRLQGPIRVTPWRSLGLGPGIRYEELAQTGDFVIAPEDPLLRVTACTGAPGCPQARGDTRQIAFELSHDILPGQHLHVSGCTKGCAHPGMADVTLVATPNGYNLIRGGKASDVPHLTDIARNMIAAEIAKAPHAAPL
jgi:precorrin-3B synthase